MKWLIASDLHGSALYCEKLLEAFDREKADRLLLLGDILYHGPRNALPAEYQTKDVAAMLNERKDRILCVRGNCDTEVDQMVLEFPMAPDFVVIPVGKRLIYATHGHHYNDDYLPSMQEGDVLLHGHTHIPRCQERWGTVFMNPGSVSIPKGGSDHGYMTLEDNLALWKTLNGEEFMRCEL